MNRRKIAFKTIDIPFCQYLFFTPQVEKMKRIDKFYGVAEISAGLALPAREARAGRGVSACTAGPIIVVQNMHAGRLADKATFRRLTGECSDRAAADVF
ncbi:hypothetical protein E2P84_30340 [Burkholderia cepacia]|uniref:Uncharacterized protein n=1 Tax=Burkholderia cepacia TaxID=292 RepID=A0AAQ1YV97_BURCE|nr:MULTISPECIES: hypothetical protein [Burkholderia]EMD9442433.1 hypothetical protein [Burkholderia cepacia]MBJ9754502.1 hypothetical protein [Burkholderia cepacia]MCA7896391.1 hypothetical protein [Burkholderia cepacia]MCA7905079.1 hypothetical protein [Burkholderia cepacia]MCA7933202.1 hypothetical protein [Burkholderia cepacia]